MKLSKTLLPPFFLTSTAAKPLNNAAVPLRTFLSGNEYPSKRLRRPPPPSSSSLKQVFRRVSVEPKALIMSEINEPSPTSKR